MKKVLVYAVFIFSTVLLLSLNGCETPEGGSSIPWGRPESWEGESTLGIPLE